MKSHLKEWFSLVKFIFKTKIKLLATSEICYTKKENRGNSMQENSNPLKYPSIGLFMSFKSIMEVIIYIFECLWRGIVYVFKDIPVFLWQHASIKVSEAVAPVNKSASINTDVNIKAEEKKKNILNMDINDLLKNTSFMKKKIEGLEKEKLKLLSELETTGKIRSKEAQVFRFTAKNRDGKIETGIMNGFSKLDVNTFLVQDGYDVYKIETNELINLIYGKSSLFSVRLKNKDLLFWLTQLSTYLKSGIPLTDSIRILNRQMNKNATYKRAFQSIIYELTMGESFSSALEKQGNMFPALLINMIKAAEATGELEETLDDMANYYEEIEKTRKQMISALTYPTIIMIFALAVITFIMVWVVPQFVNIYEEAGATLNGFTVLILNISNFLQANALTLILMISVIILILVLLYQKIKAFRKSLQTFAMKIPIIGKVIIYNEMTIFSKTFASLLKNNVFITDSIDILSKITNNEIYKEIMYNTIDNIVKGDKISLAFKDHWAVPDVAYFMIETGESTGQLAEMMGKVSSYYQEMHRSMVNSLKSFIEPITICLLAVIVGVILMAVMVPMFDLYGQLE